MTFVSGLAGGVVIAEIMMTDVLQWLSAYNWDGSIDWPYLLCLTAMASVIPIAVLLSYLAEKAQ